MSEADAISKAGTASEQRGALPNLIVIGAMKCGTSSLHRYLDLHPQIAMSPLKEPDFFVIAPWANWERGVERYRTLFDPSAAVRGEASVNYSNLPHSEGTAERIAQVLGGVRLIFMVRDPIERAISHYIHAQTALRESRGIEQALADFESRYVQRGRYAMQLEPYVHSFGLERIHVDTQDALLADREATMQRIFGFLEVDTSFTSPQFDRMWEVSAGKTRKFSHAYRLSRRLGGRERWAKLPPRLRWLGERIAFHPTGGGIERPEISAGLRAQLQELYAPEVDRLRELTGLAFEGWSV